MIGASDHGPVQNSASFEFKNSGDAACVSAISIEP